MMMAASAAAARNRAAAAAASAARVPTLGRDRLLSSVAGDASRAESNIERLVKPERPLKPGLKGGESDEASHLPNKATLDFKDMKMVLLEKDVSKLICSFEFLERMNWTAIGLFATLVVSLSITVHNNYMEAKKDHQLTGMKYQHLEEKVKTLEKKHKILKSRLHQIALANNMEADETDESDEEIQEEKAEEKSSSWASWFLSVWNRK